MEVREFDSELQHPEHKHEYGLLHYLPNLCFDEGRAGDVSIGASVKLAGRRADGNPA